MDGRAFHALLAGPFLLTKRASTLRSSLDPAIKCPRLSSSEYAFIHHTSLGPFNGNEIDELLSSKRNDDLSSLQFSGSISISS